MIAISDAVSIIQNNLPPREVERLAIDQALGRYLAGEVRAVEPSPRYTNSAMDGFAVRWLDVEGAKAAPIELTLVGESRAGVPFRGELAPGKAIRISTGAMLPASADTVVRMEDTTDLGDRVRINTVSKRHQDVRFRGEEISEGDLLFPRESGLFPPQIALLAAQGIGTAAVFTRPRLALVVTGTEVVANTPPAPHQIRDSNRVMLRAAITQAGGDLVHVGWAGDDHDTTVRTLDEAAGHARLILCSGGVSVGAHDHVRQAATELGFSELFWRIRQKPGKPLYCGRRGDTLLFGLPGNPVSAFMCFIYYLEPLIGYLTGRAFAWNRCRAKAGQEIINRGSRPNFVRITLDRDEEGCDRFQPVATQGSHMLTSIAHAHGFVLVPEHASLAADSWQEVYPFPWR